MSVKSRLSVAIALGAATLALNSALLVTAEPSQQNPTRTPTEEPTKAPYVFSTPIFIPTYTSATDLPPPRTPGTPRAPVTVTGGQTYTVEPGDNPSLIAKKVYGDAGKFRLIVEANNLTDTTRLRVGTVLIIPPLTPVATAPVPPAPSTALSQPTPAVISTAISPSPALSPARSAIFTPTPQPYPSANAGDLAGIAQTLLRVLGVIFLLGSLAVAGLAIMFYRDARRREKVSLIKRRLKGE